ncbi:hypothetical protein GALMADRAFT_237684 [Galerina marginata CBS 339.88]|uniref:Needs CLA4 to survive protein 3 n=1 Tax=Galerina marginata (strain CBS 339.88) TaxID=685588 RepID=A0A067TTV6_GALM3|nr:hypothetical protein GALMADRAFT_237684 [Galerina marginata CBS 339.88]
MDSNTDRKLPLDDYRRYGRQMILEGFGLSGQLKLQQASVVVVGAGGLGCPALQYLAAAGIGRIGIIDHDVVEVSNLQRQILHNEHTVGMYKTESAALAIRKSNSRIKVEAVTEPLSSLNASNLLQSYDIILDCTDNAPTRYLLSDTAVALRKPLVSGAAQRFSGQVCTYNLGSDGLCYRCLFPKPPSTTSTCEETGILGVVTGVIGNFQALEAIKIITGLHDNKSSMLVFSAISSTPFRSIDLGSRDPTCPACGKEGQKIGEIQDFDYVQFCGGPAPDWEKQGLVDGGPGYRISAKEFKQILGENDKLKIIDVRPRTEFQICQLPNSINVPLDELVANPTAHLMDDSVVETYILCRLGNDSQVAAEALRGVAKRSGGPNVTIKDVVGGLRAWAKDVDANFPVY